MRIRLWVVACLGILCHLLVTGGAHGQSAGSIVAWGYNRAGQCDVPAPNESFVAVAAGYNHSLGLKSDRTVVAWGYNGFGQCNVPSPNADFVAVAGGTCYSLGLKSDGTIVAWGYNGDGECNVPSPNADFVAVAAGGHFDGELGAQGHGLGLKSDGTIVAWGYNGFGHGDVPAPNAGFVAVADGGYHSLCLKSDGTIVAWGDNYRGQCNVPAPNESFAAAAGGAYHSLGLKSDGTIVAWGDNSYGQCNAPAPNAGFAFTAVEAGDYHSLGLMSPIPNPTTPALEATAEDRGIALSWKVPADLNSVEFLVYRRTEEEDWRCVSEPLRAEGGGCRWVDLEAEPGIIYSYEVQVIGPSGPTSRLGPVSIEMSSGPRLSFRVSPNPGRKSAGLTFALPSAGNVELRIFDAAGREAARQVWTGLRAGTHLRSWEARDRSGRPLPSGSYWLRLYTLAGVRTIRWTFLQ